MSTFSSKQYAWSDVSISIGGRIIEGITEVEYTVKQEKETLRGRGNNPHKVTRGNKSYEGKITIWQSELEAMVLSAPNFDILDLTFDVIVSYVPSDGGKTVIDVLSGCEFTETKKSMKQGDKNMVVELPIVFLGVKAQQ
ncbi:hypothetical protein [Flavobacterium hydatis]|uniref:Phage tail protein n=1 Tax=Flavobacterium hydatis TaxID=991 RepID=A0A086A3G5_FLAHY|nr:hypothetical protein [Flavobacterium hydatis]KFF11229.1 hypothetical protein IW20_20055 [Flavobacterium hydatis]OXA97894.1 hypothetical protein B0A62_03285 [Flavobacterium hydatis]